MEEGVNSEYRALLALRASTGANADMAKLEGLIEEQHSEFDALAFLGVSGSEEFHSRFLSWLLDPRGSHGDKHQFLSGFVLETIAQARSAGIRTVTLSDRPGFDWSATTVMPEWRNVVDGREGYLDILLLNRDERFLCAVENKIFSNEHSEQLTRYRLALAEGYPGFDKHHVFLSPRGTFPIRPEEQEHWTPVSYATVLQLVEQSISNRVSLLPEDVSAFLGQYATTLRRRIVADTDTNVRQLARQIYLEHRQAIELLIEHKPDFVSEGKEIFKAAIDHQQGWVLDWEEPREPRLLFFRSVDWDGFDAFKTGTGWGSGSLVTFGFDFRQGHPQLICTLGPGTDEAVRRAIHSGVAQHPDLFSRAGESFSGSYTRLDVKGPITTDADYDNWDDEAVRDKMVRWVEAFAVNEFPEMNRVIRDCLCGYESQ